MIDRSPNAQTPLKRLQVDEDYSLSHRTLHDDLFAYEHYLLPGETTKDSDEQKYRLAIPLNIGKTILQFMCEYLPNVAPDLQITTTRSADKVIQVVGNSHEVLSTVPLGDILEVGGPTLGDESLEAMYGIAPSIVSNVASEGDIGYMGPTDMTLDARELPFEDNALAGVFASCLPGAPRHRDVKDGTNTLRDQAIEEAARAIKADGYLFWNGGTTADLDKIREIGLQPRHLVVEISHHRSTLIAKYDWASAYTVIPSISIRGAFQKP